MRSIKRWIAAVFVAWVAGGCSTAPKLSNMIVTTDAFGPRTITGTLLITAALGGQNSSYWTGSKIDAENFSFALIESIRSSRMFDNVVSQGTHDYRLDAIMTGQSQPSMGFDMTVHLTVAYYLYEGEAKDLAFQTIIEASHTATMGDAFDGSTRLRKANEGAVRQNISLFLDALAKSDLN